MSDWFRPVPEGALIVLRVTPNAGRDALEGPSVLADGTGVLKIRITTQPEGGRANKAAIAILAKAMRLPRSSFSVKAGATARTKTILLDADPITIDAARERLEAAFSS